MARRIPSDTELLADGAAGAFGEFYARHLDAVSSYAGRRLPDGELIFDVVAETFARALERRQQYDPARGVAVAWLIGIARNLIADAYSEQRVSAEARRRLQMPVAHLDDDQIASIHSRSAVDLAALLGTLTAEQREAVMRRVLADQSYTEIAAQIRCSEQVARQHVSRGLARLRRFFPEAS